MAGGLTSAAALAEGLVAGALMSVGGVSRIVRTRNSTCWHNIGEDGVSRNVDAFRELGRAAGIKNVTLRSAIARCLGDCILLGLDVIKLCFDLSR